MIAGATISSTRLYQTRPLASTTHLARMLALGDACSAEEASPRRVATASRRPRARNSHERATWAAHAPGIARACERLRRTAWNAGGQGGACRRRSARSTRSPVRQHSRRGDARATGRPRNTRRRILASVAVKPSIRELLALVGIGGSGSESRYVGVSHGCSVRTPARFDAQRRQSPVASL